MASGVSRSSPTAEPATGPTGIRSELRTDKSTKQAKATSLSTSLDMCSRTVAGLSPLAAVVSARTAMDDCRVGVVTEARTRQAEAPGGRMSFFAGVSLPHQAHLDH